MIAFAVKPPRKEILLFTISNHMYTTISKIENAKNETWGQLYLRGYRIINITIEYHEIL